MALPDLTDQFISDLYPGLLHTSNKILTGGDLTPVYDGLGNKSSLRINTPNKGATISGMLTAGNLTIDGYPTYIDYIYPVGSVYFTANNVNPQTRFIGTVWTTVAQGRFIVGVGTGNDGAMDKTFAAGNNRGVYKHTLTIAEMPSHNHTYGNFQYRGDRDNDENKGYWDKGGIQRTDYTGGDQPHENTPPGFGLYVWQRIS